MGRGRTFSTVALSDTDTDDDEPWLMLLNDCRTIFENIKGNFEGEIASASLVEKLHALEDRPWNEGADA